jgi:hypothetical protein
MSSIATEVARRLIEIGAARERRARTLVESRRCKLVGDADGYRSARARAEHYLAEAQCLELDLVSYVKGAEAEAKLVGARWLMDNHWITVEDFNRAKQAVGGAS